MKLKKSLTVLIVGFFMTQSIFAIDFYAIKETYKINTSNEELKPVNQELIFYPLSFMVSGLELGTEFKVKYNNTLRFSVGYFMSESAFMYNYNLKQMEGFRTEAQYRFYIRDFSAPNNFFLGVCGVYKDISLSRKSRSYDGLTGITKVEHVKYVASAVSFGAALGYRTRFFDIFSMDFFLGGGITPINSGEYHITHVFILPTKKSINFKAGWTLGITI